MQSYSNFPWSRSLFHTFLLSWAHFGGTAIMPPFHDVFFMYSWKYNIKLSCTVQFRDAYSTYACVLKLHTYFTLKSVVDIFTLHPMYYAWTLCRPLVTLWHTAICAARMCRCTTYIAEKTLRIQLNYDLNFYIFVKNIKMISNIVFCAYCAWYTCTVRSDFYCRLKSTIWNNVLRRVQWINFHYVRFNCWSPPESLSTC